MQALRRQRSAGQTAAASTRILSHKTTASLEAKNRMKWVLLLPEGSGRSDWRTYRRKSLPANTDRLPTLDPNLLCDQRRVTMPPVSKVQTAWWLISRDHHLDA